MMTFFRSLWAVVRGRASVRFANSRAKVVDLSEYRLERKVKDLDGRILRRWRFR